MITQIGSTSSERRCAICSKLGNSYNYGVLSCNACKMFFRRATLGKSEKFCINNDNCDTSNLILTCRQCRYNKCLKMGMRIVTNQYDSLDDIIKVLAKWNLDRSNKLMNFQCFEDPTLDQVIQKHPVFTKKPSNLSFSKSEWGFMEQLTTVEFMSKFEFTRHLFSEDFRIVLKSSCFKIASFIKAVRSYSMKKEDIRYPDGELIVPMELVPFCTSEFLARVQCRLIGRIIELKLKEEEFLLLIAIFVCDPTANNLTARGREILSFHQNVYNDALLQLCLRNEGSCGPARFNDLLSVCHVVNKHVEDIGQLCFMFSFHPPTTKYKRLCAELLGA